jgi:hypothetical protein
VTADGGQDDAEYRSLDDAVIQIRGLDELADARHEDPVVDAEELNCDEPAPEHSDEVEEHGERGRHDEAGQDARGHQVVKGVDRHRPERVDLFCDPHRAELGSHGGARAGCDHEACEDRR